jgi:SAM-dependent methyltransferase
MHPTMPSPSTLPPTYKRAVRWPFLTRHYDRLVALLMRERRFRTALLAQLRAALPAQVLDIGCGTGSLLILLHRAFPTAEIHGLDGDPEILALAARKTMTQPLISLKSGYSTNMPYSDGTFNAVTCSLMLHHLTDADKEQTLREAWRILRSGGTLHIADWGKPSNALMRGLFYVIQLLDGFETTTANIQGRIPAMMTSAGFRMVTETDRVNTALGSISLYYGIKPFSSSE